MRSTIGGGKLEVGGDGVVGVDTDIGLRGEQARGTRLSEQAEVSSPLLFRNASHLICVHQQSGHAGGEWFFIVLKCSNSGSGVHKGSVAGHGGGMVGWLSAEEDPWYVWHNRNIGRSHSQKTGRGASGGRSLQRRGRQSYTGNLSVAQHSTQKRFA